VSCILVGYKEEQILGNEALKVILHFTAKYLCVTGFPALKIIQPSYESDYRHSLITIQPSRYKTAIWKKFRTLKSRGSHQQTRHYQFVPFFNITSVISIRACSILHPIFISDSGVARQNHCPKLGRGWKKLSEWQRSGRPPHQPAK